MRDDEVIKAAATSQGLTLDQAFERHVLNSHDIKSLEDGPKYPFGKAHLESFSKCIQDERRDLLHRHSQLKNDLSAHGKNTAGPNMDPELIAWGEKYERVRKASIGIAKKAIQKGFPVPKYEI